MNKEFNMLTVLEIINDMLASAGIAPLSEGSTVHPNYIKANNKLNKVNRVYQGRGWWFNKSKRTLMLSTAGEAVLPSNAMHADPVDTSMNLVIRDGKMWDMDNNTAVLTAPVEVWFVENVDIVNLPPTAQTLLQARAVYDFYVDENGGEPRLSAYRATLQEAEVRHMQEHLRNSDVNFFNGASYQMFRRT